MKHIIHLVLISLMLFTVNCGGDDFVPKKTIYKVVKTLGEDYNVDEY